MIVVTVPSPSFLHVISLAVRFVMQGHQLDPLTGVPYYLSTSLFCRGGAHLRPSHPLFPHPLLFPRRVTLPSLTHRFSFFGRVGTHIGCFSYWGALVCPPRPLLPSIICAAASVCSSSFWCIHRLCFQMLTVKRHAFERAFGDKRVLRFWVQVRNVLHI